MKAESRCGIVCSQCDYRAPMSCPTCPKMEKPFWGKECALKTCCESKEHLHCGECKDFPCELLEQFAFDPEQGDEGKRIQQCREWRAVATKEQLMKYALSKNGATQDFKEEWGWDRIQVGDKLFLTFARMKGERPIATVKLAPEHGGFLRQQYPDKIIPGFYMNKEHWNTIYLDESWPAEFLLPLVDEAYDLVFQSLAKKKQKEILENQ